MREKIAVFTFPSGILRTKSSIPSSFPVTRCLHLFRLKAKEACTPLDVEQEIMNPKFPLPSMEIYLVGIGPGPKITYF